MLKFFVPTSGTIRINGRDISQLSANSLRERIILCEQVVRIFHGTILENVAFGHPVTKDEADRALFRVGLGEAVRAMPAGGDTILTFQGSNLSGGQRQRLLIARALIRRPRILLFDEATSALDNQTQSIVSASLARLNVTRVIIAHRLSTVAQADRVVVLVAGRLVQSGTFAELSAGPGVFAEFAKRQLL
jgi:ABC-type bacteriocin/lantibiotic exporter with double-glycine peptidase domain